MCAMTTTPSFKSACSLYLRQFYLPMSNLLYSPSFPSKTLPLFPCLYGSLFPCLYGFVSLPPPPPNLQYGAGSTVVPSHCFWDPCGREEIKEQRSWPINFKWDNSVKKSGLLRGPVSFFCLSVLCKDLLRREVFVLLPVVVPDCFLHLHVTLGRMSVIVAFSSNNIHQQPHHTCWKFYFQMYNLW